MPVRIRVRPKILDKNIFRTFEIAYDNSFNKIYGFPKYTISHITTEVSKTFVKLRLCYTSKIFIVGFKKYESNFTLTGVLFKYCLFFKQVCDNFYRKSIIEIINWVKRHEPSGRFCPFFIRLFI